MKLADIIATLDGTQLAGGESDRSVGAVVANDLMSDVLLNDSEDILLLTSLASDQAIRTANIVGAMCVVGGRGVVLRADDPRPAVDVGAPRRRCEAGRQVRD